MQDIDALKYKIFADFGFLLIVQLMLIIIKFNLYRFYARFQRVVRQVNE